MRPNSRRTRYTYVCRCAWRWLKLRLADLQAWWEGFVLRNIAAPEPVEVSYDPDSLWRGEGLNDAAIVQDFLEQIEPTMLRLTQGRHHTW